MKAEEGRSLTDGVRGGSDFERQGRAQAVLPPEHVTRPPERMIGAGVGFERTRRITGYLVGDLKRFNNAKRAEERDRVKHGGPTDEKTDSTLAETGAGSL